MEAISKTELAEIEAMISAPPIPGVVTGHQLSGWLGISAQRVSVLGRDGTIPRLPDGRYDLRAAVLAYCQSLRLKTPASALAQNPELNAEKIRMARESADKVAMQNARARGETIPAAEVAKAWAEIMTDLRAALLALPSRVAGRAGLDRRAATILDAELRAAMEAISDDR